MKNVLFTTTAAAALAFGGVAFAGGHDSGNVGFAGEAIVGYNDDIEGGLFFQNDITVKFVGEIAPGYDVSASFGADTDIDESAETSASVTFDGATLEAPGGTLSFDDDMDEATAAWEFFDDTEGMNDSDMPSAEDDAGIKWVGEVGAFGYAISTGAEDGDSDIPTDFALGLGGSVGAFDLGLGYDDAADTFGVSAKGDIAGFDVHVAFQDGAAGEGASIGVQAGFEPIPGLETAVYFATNNTSPDQYGVLIDYANGPLEVGIDFHTGASGFTDNFEIDVSYDMGNGIVGYVGYDDADGVGYVGAEIQVADNVMATIAYAEADEISGPEFKDGTSAFLTINY